MKRCKVCNKRLYLDKDKKYLIEKRPQGPSCLVEPKIVYEAFDCEWCGCQNIVNVREVEQ